MQIFEKEFIKRLHKTQALIFAKRLPEKSVLMDDATTRINFARWKARRKKRELKFILFNKLMHYLQVVLSAAHNLREKHSQ